MAGITGKLTQGAVDAGFLYASDVPHWDADFREPNLITLQSAFEFCRDIQTIWAVCFRHQLRALFFLWSDLIIELRNLLAVWRE